MMGPSIRVLLATLLSPVALVGCLECTGGGCAEYRGVLASSTWAGTWDEETVHAVVAGHGFSDVLESDQDRFVVAGPRGRVTFVLQESFEGKAVEMEYRMDQARRMAPHDAHEQAMADWPTVSAEFDALVMDLAGIDVHVGTPPEITWAGLQL